MDPRHHRASHGDRHPQQSGLCLFGGATQAEAEGRLKEAKEYLDKAEWHLTEAVKLKPISPRPRNNLGRVLLRRSQQCEAEAREAEAKGKTDPAEAAKAKQLKDEAKAKLNAAIEQFEEAVRLDPSLLEARLNLGEVYMSLNDLDKAEIHYREILKLRSEQRQGPGDDQQLQPGLFRVGENRLGPQEVRRGHRISAAVRWN